MNESEKVDNQHHLITFCCISYTNSLAFGLFQNFLFDIVNQNKYVTFRFNCALQILSLFNFCGSFFWSYLADRTRQHNFIQVFNAIMYGLLVVAILGSKEIEVRTLQMTLVFIITIMREFTLGSFGSVSQGLQLNYLIRNKKNTSLISFVNISQNLGVFSAMFFSWIISSSTLKDNLIFCKLIMYSISIIGSSFLLIFVAPRFRVTSLTNERYVPEENGKNQESILTAFKKPSLILFYITLTIAGIYKCIISNFIPTFLRIHGKPERVASICFTIRSFTDSLIYLPLSKTRSHIVTFFIICIFTSALSVFVDVFFQANICALVIGEILKGFSRSVVTFTSVMIFKSYATPETLTQTQGLRNSAYNGFSCIIFGLIALMFVPEDLMDPKNTETDKEEMRLRMMEVLDKSYMFMSLFLILSLVLAVVARTLKKNNL